MNQFKKNNKKLEKLRGIFFQVGLIAAGGLTLLAFEWTSPIRIAELPGVTITEEADWVIPPIVKIEDEVEKPEVKHEKKLLLSDLFKKVDDDLKEEKKEEKKEDYKDPKEPFDPDKWKVVEPKEPEELPVFIAGEMPHYKDCKDLNEQERKVCTQNKMYEHFGKKIRIPENIKIQGKAVYKAFVYFEVNKKGEIVNVKIQNDAKHAIPKELEREAFNAVQSLPQMEPGKNHGKPVSVKYAVPIVFTVI